jgi:hypothetical protein
MVYVPKRSWGIPKEVKKLAIPRQGLNPLLFQASKEKVALYLLGSQSLAAE